MMASFVPFRYDVTTFDVQRHGDPVLLVDGTRRRRRGSRRRIVGDTVVVIAFAVVITVVLVQQRTTVCKITIPDTDFVFGFVGNTCNTIPFPIGRIP